MEMYISVTHSWTNLALCLTCRCILTACELVQKMAHEQHVMLFTNILHTGGAFYLT